MYHLSKNCSNYRNQKSLPSGDTSRKRICVTVTRVGSETCSPGVTWFWKCSPPVPPSPAGPRKPCILRRRPMGAAAQVTMD